MQKYKRSILPVLTVLCALLVTFGIVILFAGKDVRAEDSDYYTVTYDANGGTFKYSDGTTGTTWSEEVYKTERISLKLDVCTTNGYLIKDWESKYGSLPDSETHYPIIDIRPTYGWGPTRDGYVLVGWEIVGEDTPVNRETGYKAYTSLIPKSSVTLKAVWEKLYKVTLDYNGGKDAEGNTSKILYRAKGWAVDADMSYDSAYKGDGYRYNVYDVTKNGYGIKGWKIKGGSGDELAPAYFHYLVEKDTVFEIVWAKDVTITFESGEGHTFATRIVDEDTREVYYDEKTSGEVHALEGTDFEVYYTYFYPEDKKGEWCHSWTLKGDDPNKLYRGVDTVKAKDGMTFVGVWGAPTTITYDYAGGFDMNTETASEANRVDYRQCVGAQTRILKFYDSDIVPAGYLDDSQIEKPGMIIDGWTLKGSTDGKLYQPGDYFIVQKNMTFVAHWVPATEDDKYPMGISRPQYTTVKYETNGGKFVDNVSQEHWFTKTDDFCAFYQVPWNENTDVTMKIGYFDTEYTEEKYYDNYGYYFEERDGTPEQEELDEQHRQEVKDKTYHVCEPLKVEREGYKFLGWQRVDDVNNKIYSPGDEYHYKFGHNDRFNRKILKPSGDIVFVAQWEKEEGSVDSKSQINDFVNRIYKYVLDREPEAGGAEFWANELFNFDYDGAQVALGFIGSQEFVDRKTTDEQFVTILYNTFFGREPEENGFKFWVDSLKNGTLDRSAVANGFVYSQEWADTCASYGIKSGGDIKPQVKINPSDLTYAFVERMYTTAMKRASDAEGAKFWANELSNFNYTGEQVGTMFFLSDEMKGFGLDNKEFVTRLYKTFMDRDPEQGGFEFWVKYLDDGNPRENVVLGFTRSDEFVKKCVEARILPF